MSSIKPEQKSQRPRKHPSASRRHSSPQQLRSRNTREKLINAALDCIAELGFHGATMDLIVARAGVSRGAQVHHFPTKLTLITEAFDAMLNSFIVDLRSHMESIRLRDEKPNELFKYLWETYFSAQLFSVTMELVVQAKTNVELRTELIPIVERFHRNIDDSWYLLCRDSNAEDNKLVLMLNLTLSLLRGMGFQKVLWDRPEYFRQLLDEWLAILSLHLELDTQ
jgi:AcrR family transcriptional regulator